MPATFLWLQRICSEMCVPLCTHHVVTYTALSNSQKVSKRTGRKVEVCVYGCICVGMCLCIIVYVWAFVYVYMVLFVWVGLCMYVWPFQQCTLSLQESCMIRANCVTLGSYHARFRTEFLIELSLTVFLGFAPLCYRKQNTSRNHIAYCYGEFKAEDIDTWAISLLHYLRWRLQK